MFTAWYTTDLLLYGNEVILRVIFNQEASSVARNAMELYISYTDYFAFCIF